MGNRHRQLKRNRYHHRRKGYCSDDWCKSMQCENYREKLEMRNVVCWCGVKNPYFSDEPYSGTCGGNGTLDCHCGGDLCVCHNHGEVECYGCADCSPWDDDEDGYDGEFGWDDY